MLKLDLNMFDNFMQAKGLSPQTRKLYKYQAIKFINFGAFNNESINAFLIRKENQNTLARSFVLMLKKFLIYYREELQLSDEEFNKIIQSEVPQITGRKKVRLVVPLTKQDIDLLEQTLETEEEKLMLLICYHGGLRLQELMRIRGSSFNWDTLKEAPLEMGEVRVLGKGNKEGICLIPNWLVRRIAHYVKSPNYKGSLDDYIFKYDKSGRFFEQKLKTAGIKCGLTRKDGAGGWIKSTITHPHRLRHSFGYNLVKKGVDIRYVKEALRHSNLSSTQIYTQLSKDDLKEKLQEVI